MSANYKKLGDYITQRREKNTAINLPICGVCREGLIPPKQQDADISLYNVFYKNDFIFNPARMELNSITLNTEYDKAICSSLYEIFYINDTSKLLPEFLFVQLKTDNFVRFCEFQGQGSVREYCRFANISEYPVIVPDLKVQKKIVNTYNTITKRIQLKQKINENLEKTAISILNKKIGQTVFSNSTEKEIEEKKNSLPQGWKLITISEYCSKMESGSTPSRTENEYWINGNIPWLKSGEVHNNITFETEEYITEKGLKETSTKLLPVDTVLMAMYGVTAGEVGYLNIPATTNQAICGMICKNKIEAAYLYFALIQNQKMISQMSNGGAQNNLSKAFIENMFIVVPKEDVLQKLKINVVLQHFILTSKEIKKLNKMKQLIVSKLSKR